MIVNGLLCYAIHHLDSGAGFDIEHYLYKFYKHGDVVAAKKALWNACKGDLSKYDNRKNSESRAATEAHIQDIMKALKKLDGLNKTPEVYVKDLDSVPDRQPADLNYAMLVQRVADLTKYKVETNDILARMASDILELQEAKRSTTNAGNDQPLSVNNVNNAEQITNEQILAQQTEVTSNADTDVANNESSSDSLTTEHQPNTPPQQSHQSPTQQTTPQQQQSPPQQQTSPQQQQTSQQTLQPQPATLPQGDTVEYVSLRPSWANHPNSGSHHPPVRRPTSEGRPQRLPSSAHPVPSRPVHVPQQRPTRDNANGNHRPESRINLAGANRQQSQIDEDGYTVVQSRRRRRVIGNATTTSGNLRGADHPPTREIFISRVTTGDKRSITEYMETRGIRVHHFEKMSHYQAKFLSFKIKISVFDKDAVLNENFWPYGIQCMMWKNPRPVDSRYNNENNVNYINGHN